MQIQERNELEFSVELNGVLDHLRAAITELLSAIDVDPSVPYAVSRQLGINKNLAWKVCRIVSTTDSWECVELLPGTQGMDIFLNAVTALGAEPRHISAIRAALAEFDALVETHAGNRRTLDLMLASDEHAPSEPMEETRRLAFEGNSAIWGLQARVRFGAYFVAPNAQDPDWVDTINLGGLIDVRRLRPEVTAPVFMAHAYNDDGTSRNAHHERLDPTAADDDASFLMPRFCSASAPALVPVRRGGIVRYELPRGPVGRTALASWVFGARIPKLGMAYQDEHNRYGQHSTRLFVPVEHLFIDLFIHRSLPFASTVTRGLYSQISGEPFTGVAREGDQLPLRERIQEIGGRPPAVATPLLPRYSEMIRWTFDRVGWNAADFTCCRFAMRYPPIPTVLLLRYDLRTR